MPPKAEPESQARRQLKIKVGSVTRLRKEIVMYEKELEAQRAKVAKMREDGAEAASIKQQEGVQAESAMMIPDCRTRLEAALQELQGVVAEYGDDAELTESEELAAAKQLIEEVEQLFE